MDFSQPILFEASFETPWDGFSSVRFVSYRKNLISDAGSYQVGFTGPFKIAKEVSKAGRE